jgi:hypothetical protein
MANFVQLDENNIVTQVIVVSNEDIKDENGIEKEELGIQFCKKIFGDDTNWKQTSYNNNFRCRYAGIDCIYDPTYDVFYRPQPYPSWYLDLDTFEWKPPVPKPDFNIDSYHTWNEKSKDWDIKKIG